MIKKRFKTRILVYLFTIIFSSLILTLAFAECPPCPSNTDFTLFNYSPTATARCVAVKDGVAFIGAGGSILVYDNKNISLPEKVAEIKTFGIIMQLVIADNFLYVAAGSDGMYVFDVQDHRSPKCIMHLPFDRWCSNIFLFNDLIFLGQEGGLKVFKNNRFLPANISLVKEISIEGQVENILIEGDKLFAACSIGGLYIFSLKDNFHELKHISLPHKTTYALACSQGFIYFNFNNMIYALDTKSFIYKKLHTFPWPENGLVYHMIIREDYIYVFFDDSIYIFQIKAPFSLSYIRKNILPGDHVRRGVLDNNFLFAADEDAGVMVFDVKAPERFIRKSIIETPGEVVGLAMDEDNLFVCDFNGLSIYNIQDPLKLESSNKTFIKYLDAARAVIQGKYIFIGRPGNINKGSYVDICELPNIKKLRTLRFPGELWDIKILKSQLFVATDHNFYIYDIKSIQSPKLIYSFRVPGFLKNINFYKDKLLITEFDKEYGKLPTLSLKLDELGKVVKPFAVSSLASNPLGEYVRSILLTEHVNQIIEIAAYAYIAGNSKLFIFSKTNNALRLVHIATLPDSIRDIAVHQFQDFAYVYLAVEDAGLYVLRHRIKRFAPEP